MITTMITAARNFSSILTNKHGENHLISLLELGMIDSDDDEIETISHNVGALNSGKSYSFNFIAYPDDWKDCDELQATIYTETGIVVLSTVPSPKDDTKTETKTESDDISISDDIGIVSLSSSGGGCELGLGAFALSILLLKRKAR